MGSYADTLYKMGYSRAEANAIEASGQRPVTVSGGSSTSAPSSTGTMTTVGGGGSSGGGGNQQRSAQQQAQDWINNPSSGMGGMNQYVSSQQQRYNQAIQSGDTDMIGRLLADAQRVGYSLNAPQNTTPNQNQILSEILTQLMGGQKQQAYQFTPYIPPVIPTLSWEEAQSRARSQLNPLYADLLSSTMADFDRRMADQGMQGPYIEKLRLNQQNDLANKQAAAIAELANMLVGQSEENALARESQYLQRWQTENQLGMQDVQSQRSTGMQGLNTLNDIFQFLTTTRNDQQSQRYTEALQRTQMFGTVQQGDDQILGVPVGTPIWEVVAQAQQARASQASQASAQQQQNLNYLFRVWEATGVAPGGLERLGVPAGTPINDPRTAQARLELEQYQNSQQNQQQVQEGTARYQQLYGLDQKTARAAWELIENSPSYEAALADFEATRAQLQANGINTTRLEQILRERGASSTQQSGGGGFWGNPWTSYLGSQITLPQFLQWLISGQEPEPGSRLWGN